ncbi:LysR family transcriptional regulator [Cereibacter johrii]|uniref:LysR family transcriptional regulator n=1 Tax=Cereibacter johrii TaxID=445629 RepID=UPI000DCAE606|nr:LysR family transcriptional regulator [Cereibacter johrii]MEA5159767.1 LysR family transcriptional regulator [Cereibacter johrii]RAZ86319.1 LysR family transcriptional regulator [Cereibacter johrii]
MQKAMREEPASSDLRVGVQAGPELTFRKLKAFWAVAQSQSLTGAAKLLGIAQPSLSQQIIGLEQSLGYPLFVRRSNRMILTEAGVLMLRKAEPVLRGMQDLEDTLAAYGSGQRHPLRLAGVESLLRTILPEALRHMDLDGTAECDLLEGAPADVLEMLYSRQADIGLLAANSISEASTGFLQIPIMADPTVLAVPESLDLGGVARIEDLAPEAQAILGASIQIAFGTQHSRRIESWFSDMLPQNRMTARVRSFETALSMVRAGLGICIVPALSVGPSPGVRLYHAGLEPRRIVALIQPAQHRTGRHAAVVAALQAAGSAMRLPPIEPLPPLLARP